MVRVRSQDRLAALVDAAAAAFVAHGYARTQVDDVANRLGVAKGTVYGYVTSKDALFALAVTYADGAEPLPAPDRLPLDASDLPQPDMLVRDRLTSELADLALLQALQAPATDAAAQIEDIVSDVVARLLRNRVAIKLVDRCAPEFPELAKLWFDGGRWAQTDVLRQYLQTQADAGRLRLPGDPDVVARSIIELCALWTVHIPWDPSPRQTDDAVIVATIPRMVRAMLDPCPTPTPRNGS
jgi:AcrR family transcriptional regulator